MNNKLLALSLDANSLHCDLRNLSHLLNIVLDDLEENGENEERRKMTVSALYVIHGQISLLADMQSELAGRLEGMQREAAE